MQLQDGRDLIDHLEEPGFDLRVRSQIQIDKASLIKLTGRRKICNGHLVAAKVRIVRQSGLYQAKRALEHDLIEFELALLVLSASDALGKEFLEDEATDAQSEISMVLIKVHIDQSALYRIGRVPVIGTSSRLRQVPQDGVALAQSEDFTRLLVDFLDGGHLPRWVNANVRLLHVLALAHGDKFDLMVDFVQLAEGRDCPCRLTAEVNVEEQLEV